MNRLHRFVDRIANGKTMAGLLAVAFSLVAYVNLAGGPLTQHWFLRLSNGIPWLDGNLFYSAAKASAAVDAMGHAGRQAYLLFYTTFDLVFPIAYSFALAVTLAVIFRSAFAADSWIQRLSLLPFLAGMFDYLENITIASMLIRYPSPTPVAAALAGWFTLIKWLFVPLGLLLIGIGLLRLLWNRVARSNATLS